MVLLLAAALLGLSGCAPAAVAAEPTPSVSAAGIGAAAPTSSAPGSSAAVNADSAPSGDISAPPNGVNDKYAYQTSYSHAGSGTEMLHDIKLYGDVNKLELTMSDDSQPAVVTYVAHKTDSDNTPTAFYFTGHCSRIIENGDWLLLNISVNGEVSWELDVNSYNVINLPKQFWAGAGYAVSEMIQVDTDSSINFLVSCPENIVVQYYIDGQLAGQLEKNCSDGSCQLVLQKDTLFNLEVRAPEKVAWIIYSKIA
jgi:hypothetical protein